MRIQGLNKDNMHREMNIRREAQRLIKRGDGSGSTAGEDTLFLGLSHCCFFGCLTMLFVPSTSPSSLMIGQSNFKVVWEEGRGEVGVMVACVEEGGSDPAVGRSGRRVAILPGFLVTSFLRGGGYRTPETSLGIEVTL